MVDGSATEQKELEPKATVIKAVSVLENEYFYPPANGYDALTVRAATIEDANKIYLDRRRPVKPEEKVEANEPVKTNE